MTRLHRALLASALLLLGACAGRPAHRVEPFVSRASAPDARAAACARLIAATDDAVDAAKVRDGGAHRVPGFPYLRADRFAAAQARRLPAGEWLASLRALDRSARGAEFANLMEARRALLVARSGEAFPGVPIEDAVDACADRLLAAAIADGSAPQSVVVPDDYQAWKRVAGLYVFTKYPFSAGVRGYQQETERTFAIPLAQLPVRGPLERYVPPFDAAGVDGPDVDARMLELIERHAPQLEIETVTDHDRPGTPTLDDDGAPQVDVAHPVGFVRVARTLEGGRVLTQLVYSFWFPSRPPATTFDALGGRLDGIIWRVTLAPDGRALVYDTIHNCGCFHQFFPTPRAVPKPRPDAIDEWAFVPQTLPDVDPNQRISLRLASRTHYLQRVSVVDAAAPGTAYAFARDDDLRSIPMRDGTHRSLFRPDGIVAGTERGERWLFWPMGVQEPGAMRQWGRHATAFVGRRHFDDANIIERYFDLRP
jgi:hypothetical protein